LDIETARADLKKRQESLAKRLNEILALEKELGDERSSVIHEITMNNGEARMLNRLSDNGDKPKKDG